MENQQEFFSFVQDQVSQWPQLAQDQQLYSAVVAVLGFLVAAILYGFRIGSLKKGLSKLTKTNSDIQASLDTAQKHNESLKDQIGDLNKQLQQAGETTKAEARRANEADQRLVASNQQLADSLNKLVECFELNLDSVPDADAENLLTVNQSVIERVSERFQKEQEAKTQLQLSFHTESAKLAEKEMLITSLQHRLDSQTQQLAQMELAIEQYEAAQRQLEADREQQLAAAVAKQQADASRVVELEKQQAEKQAAIVTAFGRKAKPETPKEVSKPTPSVSDAKSKEPVKLASEQISEPTTETAPVSEMPKEKKQETKGAETGKLKGFFGKAMERITKLDEKLGTQTTIEKASETEQEESAPQPVPEPVQVAEIEKKPEAPKENEAQAKPSEGMGVKVSNLFGGFKKKPANQASDIQPEQESEAPVVENTENESVDSLADKEPAKPAKKLAGLFGKLKR